MTFLLVFYVTEARYENCLHYVKIIYGITLADDEEVGKGLRRGKVETSEEDEEDEEYDNEEEERKFRPKKRTRTRRRK